MNRNLGFGILCGVVLLVVGTGCGSPEVGAPDSLEYSSLLLKGARDVALDVAPKIYFNGDVDSSSVTQESFYLESATLNVNEDACEGAWSSVDGQAGVDGSNPRLVVFTPDASLQEATCYRLTCTTAVRGTELGPLRAVPCNPAEKDSCRRDVGAEQIFWTIIP